ncbi:hypothetical protein OS493_040300 [Desmophyllum pertusum]|uniref:Uncharacterized protein n=1 Tax=Desmophyllum pertusum TaxID=174260 RepID=A0A9W9ZV52_9CNID|nr:hypothetical protein OS493_040300 [Desmophyllum pertusum]
MSSRFRNLNIGRTLSRVPTSSSKLRVLPSSKSMESLCDQMNDSVITESGLKGTRLNQKRPPTLALVAHNSKLPDDVITPVLPPILPSPSFELPRIQRHQHSNNLDNQSTPQGPVPSLCVNDQSIPDAHEKYFEEDLDNIRQCQCLPGLQITHVSNDIKSIKSCSRLSSQPMSAMTLFPCGTRQVEDLLLRPSNLHQMSLERPLQKESSYSSLQGHQMTQTELSRLVQYINIPIIECI